MADRTEASIEIDAEPAAILDVIADLPAYPQWSQGIRSVEVLAADGARPLHARFTLDAGLIKDVYELDYAWAEDSVSWSLAQAEVFTAMDGSYELTPTTTGATRVRYQLTVDVRIPMMGMMKRAAEKVIIDTALKGLKARVESHGASAR